MVMADSYLTHSGDPRLAKHQSAILTPEFGPNAARNAEMHRLRGEGWSYGAIGRLFGVSAFSARKGVGRHARPPMSIFGMSVRASNALREALSFRNHCTAAPTLDAITTLSYRDIRGAGSAREVAAMLLRHGHKMPDLPKNLLIELETWRADIIYATPKLQQAAYRRADMKRLREEGWTAAAIAAKFGVSAGRVSVTLSFYKPPNRWEEGLSVRARNALRHGLNVPPPLPIQFDVVAALSYKQISNMHCLGRASAEEIATLVWQYGAEIKGMPRKIKARFGLLPARPGRIPE
jgi:hypothetical protein